MDTAELMEVEPGELAEKLLRRRIMLKDSLPVIRNLEAEEDSLSPKVGVNEKRVDDANSKVAAFKEERDRFQTEVGGLIPEVKEIREAD